MDLAQLRKELQVFNAPAPVQDAQQARAAILALAARNKPADLPVFTSAAELERLLVDVSQIVALLRYLQ